jgi:hypothetical protein
MGTLGKLTWVYGEDADRTTYETEPDTTYSDRWLVLLYRVLPVEWLL